MADFSLNVKLNGVEQAVTTVNELEAALRATREELRNTQIGSQAFEELSTQAQALQREFVNSYKETTNFQKGIAELGQSVGSLASTVTAGFTIATSAFQLFGSESEELSEAQVKAQQALALALSATTIATNAKTLSEDLGNVAAALGLNLSRAKTSATIVDTEATIANTGATIANTVATGADAAAKTAEAGATTAAAVAQEGLNVAMAANPIGLVLAGLTALIGALVLFSGGEETARDKTKESNDALLEQSNLLKKQSDDFIALYRLRREVEILSEKDATKRAKMMIDLENEVAGLQEEAAQAEIKRVSDLNAELEKKFTSYKDAYIGTKQELVRTTTEYDEFGVAIGQQEIYEEVSFKIGENVLQNLKDNLKKREEEITKSVKAGTFTQEEGNILTQQAQTAFYIEYLTKQKEFLSQSTQADDENRKANLEDLIESFKQVRTQLEKAYADQLKIQQEAEKKRKEQEAKDLEEANRKAAAALEERKRKYKQAYDDIVKTVKDANKELNDIETNYQQELKKAQLDQTKTAIDNIEFEQQLERQKIEEIQKLSLQDLNNSVLFNKKKKELTAEGKKAEEEINKNYYEALAALDAFYLEKKKVTTDEETKITQEKADKIALIESILREEISFGDQNILDSKASLAQRERQLRIDQLDFDAQIEQSRNAMSVAEFIAYQEERLRLVQEYNQKQQAIDEAGAAAERDRNIATFKENLQKEFGVEFTESEKGQKLIKQFGENAELEYQTKLKEIKQKFRNEDKAATEKTEQEILAYRLSQIDKYTQFAAGAANTILGLFSAVNELNRVESENQLNALRDSIAIQTDTLNEGYNEQRQALDEKLEAGLISQQQYNESIKQLDTNLADSTDKLNKQYRARELAEKKKAFESDKKLKIAQAIISGIQGAVSAFTGAFQLGPIAGPIVGGILAGIVAATTAVQVAAIAKTKFDGGAPEITPPNTGGGGAATGGAEAVTQASAGGFTGFSPNLTGPSFGTPPNPNAPGTGQQGMRVYVVESDITDSQNRVRTLESNATFG